MQTTWWVGLGDEHSELPMKDGYQRKKCVVTPGVDFAPAGDFTVPAGHTVSHVYIYDDSGDEIFVGALSVTETYGKTGTYTVNEISFTGGISFTGDWSSPAPEPSASRWRFEAF